MPACRDLNLADKLLCRAERFLQLEAACSSSCSSLVQASLQPLISVGQPQFTPNENIAFDLD